jgi:hypothetical protein
MRIVEPDDPAYDSSRRISNARFDYRPRYICYCEGEDDVRAALTMAGNARLPVRIRSGGHQHEGMCSGDGVLLIDLSAVQNISIAEGQYTATIGSGAKLADVYRLLLARNLILPGGGCGDVRVGGLVQGGGWGLYSRALGLTCDRLIAFRMVMADGDTIEVTSNDDRYSDLFWAIRGAGGGNFGIITEFRFSIAGVPAPIWQFTLTWDDPALRQPVMEEWRQNFPGDPDLRATSFCRVSSASAADAPVVVAGYFLGERAPLETLLKRQLPQTYARGTVSLSPVHNVVAPEAAMARLALHHPEYQPGPPLAALRTMSVAAERAPTETCDGGWYPHKVSSCFPRSAFSSGALQTLNTYLDSAPPEPNARRYVSLHSMGGKIADPEERSCFAFRDKPFIVQYQAWWADRDDQPLGRRCLTWVRELRDEMARYTEGAFINFPDRDLVPDPDTPEGRKALLRHYYAGNLEQLIALKRKYDRENVFDFEMSIPTQ